MKESIKQLALRRLRLRWKSDILDYEYHQAIEDDLHKQTGRTHGYIGRELRQLCEDGLIERNPNEKFTYYRYIPTRQEALSKEFRQKNNL